MKHDRLKWELVRGQGQGQELVSQLIIVDKVAFIGVWNIVIIFISRAAVIYLQRNGLVMLHVTVDV